MTQFGNLIVKVRLGLGDPAPPPCVQASGDRGPSCDWDPKSSRMEKRGLLLLLCRHLSCWMPTPTYYRPHFDSQARFAEPEPGK